MIGATFCRCAKSSFIPLRHVFATFLANGKPKRLRDLWNHHRDLFITYITSFQVISRLILKLFRCFGICSTRGRQLSLGYGQRSLLDFQTPCSAKDLSSLATMVWNDLNLEVSCQRVHCPISSFKVGQRNVFIQIFGATLPGATALATFNTIPSTSKGRH